MLLERRVSCLEFRAGFFSKEPPWRTPKWPPPGKKSYLPTGSQLQPQQIGIPAPSTSADKRRYRCAKLEVSRDRQRCSLFFSTLVLEPGGCLSKTLIQTSEKDVLPLWNLSRWKNNIFWSLSFRSSLDSSLSLNLRCCPCCPSVISTLDPATPKGLFHLQPSWSHKCYPSAPVMGWVQS